MPNSLGVHAWVRIRGVYQAAQPGFRGRCTAPLLLDVKDWRIVSNESSEIVRLLNGLQLPGCTPVDLVPRELEAEMETLNALIHDQARGPNAHAAIMPMHRSQIPQV